MSENQDMPAIEMRGVNVAAMRDASFTVVENMNWLVAPGEFWVIAGQEHSGKTDLLMYGSGYPHWSTCAPGEAAAGLDSAQRDKVLWRNANELYGLTEPIEAGPINERSV